MSEGTRVQQAQTQQKIDDRQQTSRADFLKELERIQTTTKGNDIRFEQMNEAKQSQIATLLNTSADKVNLELLAKLTASMASSNIDLSAGTLSKKAAAQMSQELDNMYQGKNDFSEIAVKKEPVAQTTQNNIQSQQQKKNSDDSMSEQINSKTSSVKDYAASYANLIVNGSPDIKRKIDRTESELREKGFSDSEISEIQGSVKRSVRTDLSKSIKDAFLRRLMTKGKNIDSIMAAKNLRDALTMGENTRGVASKSFDGMKGLAEDQLKDARSEAKDFVLESLEVKLMEKILSGQTKELDSHIKDLVGLAIKLGVDMPAFVINWKKKKIDLGLFYLDPKLMLQLGLGPDGEKREDRYDLDKEEEKEILVNRLRALFMRRAIKNDIITRLDTAFKMRTLKNGLIKLGLTIDDFERIEKEGAAVARDKLLEMLKEALSERATLYDLAGPAFKLIEKRIKGLMSNLDRIGSALTVTEFESLRNTINRKMYDIAVQELHAVDAMFNAKSDPSLDKKRGHLVKLIARLKEESKIEGIDIDPRRAELVKHGVEGLKIIQERA